VGGTEKASSSRAPLNAAGLKKGNKPAAKDDWEKYQKLSLHEHILLRGDSYVGAVEPEDGDFWVLKDGTGTSEANPPQMEKRSLRYVPGLFKIFDEILVNAADNLQRDPTMSTIRVTISDTEISVTNDGQGVRIAPHPTEKEDGDPEGKPTMIPTMIFGSLLAGDNFNDNKKRCAGGRNGYGAKLANVYSTMFRVETVDFKGVDREGKPVVYFSQEWTNNMYKKKEPQLLGAVPASASHGLKQFTRVTFRPDMSKFRVKPKVSARMPGSRELQEDPDGNTSNPDSMDADILALMTRRVYDLAGCTPEHVSVWLNGKELPIRTFREYVGLWHLAAPLIRAEVVDPPECDDPVLNKPRPSKRWEVYIGMSEKGGFQHVSFVNSIATTKGGTHVNHVEGPLVERIWEKATEEYKGTFRISRPNIKSHLFLFMNTFIENPTFNSQTKEDMTSLPRDFGTACKLSEETVQEVLKCGVVESILKWAKAKQQAELAKRAKISTKSATKLIIPKLEDANMAGTANSADCTLILTEGDSAKATAMAGLGVVGRDYYGVFPLRGKVLNVRNANPAQVTANREIVNVCKILGLEIPTTALAKDFRCDERPEEDYAESAVDLLKKKMRYGSVTIMTDQDFDGSHIKGLLLNLLQYYWPSLIRHEPQFVREFVTPIVKVSKKKEVISFFTVAEYEQWKENTPAEERKKWKVKYYKGLGTSTSKEAKQYFEKLERHSLSFKYENEQDDDNLSMAFDTKRADDRKEWIRNLNPEDYIDHNESEMTISEFVKKELVFMAEYDVMRSIPNVMDGFKPTQRKIMFCAFKKKLKNDIKVAQLAGYVSEKAAYHHGEVSLEGAIVGMAQDYVGANNVKLLVPSGQFGTRIEGGKDSAASRYIYTRLNNPLTRAIFHPDDDKILEYHQDEGKWIEPKIFCPVIPMILVNGADGIGTGWSTSIPNYNPRDVVANCKIYIDRNLRMQEGVGGGEGVVEGEVLGGQVLREYIEMKPWFRNFNGEVRGKPGAKNFTTEGVVSVNEEGSTVEITELPIRLWTQAYKEKLLKMLQEEKHGITDFREHHTDVTVHFSVDLDEAGQTAARQAGYLKYFGLSSTIATSNMMGFNREHKIYKYESPLDILKEFGEYRLDMYRARKKFLLDKLKQNECELENQRKFVQAVVRRELVVRKRKIADILDDLKAMDFAPKSVLNAMVQRSEREDAEEEEEDENDEKDNGNNDERSDDDALLGGVAAAALAAASATAKLRKEYDYLLGMPLSSLTIDKVRELENSWKERVREREALEKKSIADMWEADLDDILLHLDAEDAFYDRELAEVRKQQAKAMAGSVRPEGNPARKMKMKNAPGGGAGAAGNAAAGPGGAGNAAGGKKRRAVKQEPGLDGGESAVGGGDLGAAVEGLVPEQGGAASSSRAKEPRAKRVKKETLLPVDEEQAQPGDGAGDGIEGGAAAPPPPMKRGRKPKADKLELHAENSDLLPEAPTGSKASNSKEADAEKEKPQQHPPKRARPGNKGGAAAKAKAAIAAAIEGGEAAAGADTSPAAKKAKVDEPPPKSLSEQYRELQLEHAELVQKTRKTRSITERITVVATKKKNLQTALVNAGLPIPPPVTVEVPSAAGASSSSAAGGAAGAAQVVAGAPGLIPMKIKKEKPAKGAAAMKKGGSSSGAAAASSSASGEQQQQPAPAGESAGNAASGKFNLAGARAALKKPKGGKKPATGEAAAPSANAVAPGAGAPPGASGGGAAPAGSAGDGAPPAAAA